MGFYSLNPLSPGGWTELLDEAGLPHRLRRLNEPIVVGTRTRADRLPVPAHAGGARLPAERAVDGRQSIGAGLAAGRAGGGAGDRQRRQRARPERFAAAFPLAAHAVGVVDETDEDGGLIRWSRSGR